MKLKKNFISLNTEGLNKAVNRSKNFKTSKRMSQIATLMMTFLFAATLTGCGSSLYGEPKEETNLVYKIDNDANLNTVDDILDAELGLVWTNRANLLFSDCNSYQEMYINTPEANLDFAYYNEENLSIGEIISNFKLFLSTEDKDTETEFVAVTNGKVIKDSYYQLSSNDDEYSIFTDAYILRYNEEKTTLSIFSLETTIIFSDLETSYSKYTSTPETRTEENNNLKYNSLIKPKAKVKK